jgi:hypothetical protein
MGRVIGPPPLTEPWGYFFFLVAFLAAFFLAGIVEIPPFGPDMDAGQPLVNISGDEGLDILAVG